MLHSQPNNNIHPVSLTERMQILDILRGFAVFGILAVNIGGFAAPVFFPGYVSPELTWYDKLAETLTLFFAEGKFYTIFSFLFGLGFSVQLARAETKGKDVRSFYPRRLWVLFAFGILHAVFLWIGDILRLYALLGFALLAFRKRSNKTLFIWAGIFLAVGFLLLVVIGGPHGGGEEMPGMDVIAMARQAYNGNSVLSVVIFQFFSAFISFAVIAFTQGGTVMALFLLGLLAGRMKFFGQLGEHRAFFAKAIPLGLLAGLVFNALFVFVEEPWLSSLGFTIGAPALAAVYVSGLSLLSLKEGGAKLLAPIGKVGRMALSNYVLQSVACSILFNGYGFGLYEKIGAAGLWGITFAIYLCQIPLSSWWLSRFQFGPLEWVWRSLTYRERQPFLIRP
ncbi:MAG: DUF418 domain-containing protein [Chloroflexi bacterium]|nr:DUF418 domain-containing protein [Chloroflexota bacterium]